MHHIVSASKGKQTYYYSPLDKETMRLVPEAEASPLAYNSTCEVIIEKGRKQYKDLTDWKYKRIHSDK